MRLATDSNPGREQSDKIVAGISLPARFTYGRSVMSVCMIAWTAAVFWLSTFFYKSGREQGPEAGIVFFLGGLFSLLVTVVFVLGTSNVSVDEEGVSWQVWRLTWRRIRWGDVRKIRIMALPSTELNCDMTSYVFDLGKRSFLRGAYIDDRMENFGGLVRLLNYFIEKYHIPINSEIKGSEGPIAHL